MFIQTEETPNPQTLKFLPGRVVMEKGTASFQLGHSYPESPLAQRLLFIQGITAVFFGADFITITKASDQEWFILKPAILGVLMEYFLTNQPAFIMEPQPKEAAEENPLIYQIKELLDTKIRPAVAQDGGDIIFHAFEEGVVYLRLQGACSGCPSSVATLKNGIENMLKYYVPEVMEVRAIN